MQVTVRGATPPRLNRPTPTAIWSADVEGYTKVRLGIVTRKFEMRPKPRHVGTTSMGALPVTADLSCRCLLCRP
jgi:hypothetical protein